MSGLSVEAATAARLESYVFKPDLDGNPIGLTPAVIETVAEVAGRQAASEADYGAFLAYGTSYGSFLDDVGEHLETREAPNGRRYQVLDIRPSEEDGTVMSYHLPMANPLDPNQRYQIATIAAANPHTRIVAVGNPSGGQYTSGQLTHRQRVAVASGDFSPVVEPDRHYLDSIGVEAVDCVGYSYGADKAAQLASCGDIAVPHLVTIEPVVGVRSLKELADDFSRTAEALPDYADAPGLQSFADARADAITDREYLRGLGRLSNVAIARGLTYGSFGLRLTKALRTQAPHRIQATLAWGTLSELAHIRSSRQLLLASAARQGATTMGLLVEAGLLDLHNPVVDMKLALGRHALANDIHLQAAIVTQGVTSRR